MDPHIFEVVIIVLAQVVAVAVYAVTTRERINQVEKKQAIHDQNHKDHYAHAMQDEKKFGHIEASLAVLENGVDTNTEEIVRLRDRTHDLANKALTTIGDAMLTIRGGTGGK